MDTDVISSMQPKVAPKWQESESRCNQKVHFSIRSNQDMGTTSMWASIRPNKQPHDQPLHIEIPIEGRVGRMHQLLQDGYHLHEKTLLYRRGVGFLLLHTTASKTPDTHYMLCVDTVKRKPLGLLAVSELQPSGRVESLEVFSADVSRDRQYLAFAVGVITDRSYMYMSETGHCFIVLYNMVDWGKLMKIETGSFITPSVAFEPCSPSPSTKLTVVYSDSAERPMIATYDVGTSRIVRQSMFGGIELDGDTTTQAVYTEDGCYIILLVLEDMWHDKTSLCRLFAIRANTLTLYHRYPASVVRPCHPDCVFTVMPVLKECGTRFVVEGTRIEKEYQEQTYDVPSPVGLKALCRMAILRHMPGGLRSVPSLPIPIEVQQYLAFYTPPTKTV